MPLEIVGDVVGAVVRIIGRVIAEIVVKIFFDIIFKIGIRDFGWWICRLFFRKEKPGKWLVFFVGFLAWMLIFTLLYYGFEFFK